MAIWSPTKTWLSVGFSPDGKMVGSKAVIGRPDLSGASQVQPYNLNGQVSSAVTAIGAGCPDLTDYSWESSNDRTVLQFSFTSGTTGGCLANVLDASATNNIIWAHGTGTSFGPHSSSNRGLANVNFATGSAQSLTIEVDSQLKVHAVLMTLGWGIMIPAGVIMARFFKNSPPTGWWYKMHRMIQTSGLLLATAGLVLAVSSVGGSHGEHFGGNNKGHKIMGLVVMVMGYQQPLLAIFRPHPPAPGESATSARLVWERLHKVLGYAAVLIAAITIFSGLNALKKLSGESQTVGQTVYAVVVGLLVVVFIGLQVSDKGDRSVVDLPDKTRNAALAGTMGDGKVGDSPSTSKQNSPSYVA
jgi:hypothetical protein